MLYLEKMLEAPNKARSKIIVKMRDKALLEVLYCSGLKVTPLVNLKISDLESLKTRLNNQCVFVVKEYLKLRNDNSEFLFVSHDRAKHKRKAASRLSPRSVQRLIKKNAGLAGIKEKVTPESFRKHRIDF